MSRHADTSSRLYSDLIWEVCTQYGNWHPNQHMKVGDYGKLNRETAEFERDGSIYDDGFMPDLKIKENHGVQDQQPEDTITVVSREGKNQGFDGKFKDDWPNIANGHIKGWWTFSRRRGAVVMLYKPVEKIIKEKDLLLPKLTDTLKDYALVTSVYECRMYALILTQKEKRSSEVAVGLKLPGNMGGGLHGTWEYCSTSGVWRCGGQEDESVFYPLFSLRKPKDQPVPLWKRVLHFREGSEVRDEDDGFEVYQPPWKALNEDGDEDSTSDEESQEVEDHGDASRERN